jgi:GGDEF domain-containing protein
MLRARAAQRSNNVPAVTLSVGLAVYPAAHASAAEGTAEPSSAPRLLARARQALVDAKRAGGDRVQAAGRSLTTAGTTRV